MPDAPNQGSTQAHADTPNAGQVAGPGPASIGRSGQVPLEVPQHRFTSIASSKGGRLLVGVVSGAVLVSALVYCGASLALSSSLPWVQFAFEPVVIGACVIGILFSLERFRWAPAMTVFCVAGTIAVAAPLVYRGMLGQVQIAGRDQGWSLMPWLLGRMLGAGVLAAVAGLDVIARDPRSKRFARQGVIATVPLVLAGIGIVVVLKVRSGGAAPANAAAPLSTASAGAPKSTPPPAMPGWLSTGLLTFLGIAAGASVCAAGHCFIRAFEIGSDVAEGRANPDGVQA